MSCLPLLPLFDLDGCRGTFLQFLYLRRSESLSLMNLHQVIRGTSCLGRIQLRLSLVGSHLRLWHKNLSENR